VYIARATQFEHFDHMELPMESETAPVSLEKHTHKHTFFDVVSLVSEADLSHFSFDFVQNMLCYLHRA
jgi:hypothetical protein